MAFSGLGSGVLGDPYQVTTWTQFKEIATNLSAHFKLMNDITAGSAFGASEQFTGVLDGSNYTLSGLSDNGTNAVLFLVVSGTVKNLKLVIGATSDVIFGDNSNTLANENATFENIEIRNTTQAIVGFNKLTSCTLNNVKLISTRVDTAINIATSILNCTITNLHVFGFYNVNLCYGTGYSISGSTFTDCLFLSRPKARGATTNIMCVRSELVESTTFTHCLFFGANPYLHKSKTTDPLKVPTYIRCSFIAWWYGSYPTNGTSEIMGGSLIGNYAKCYFGGKLPFAIGGTGYVFLGNNTGLFTATDCHINIEFETLTGSNTYYPLTIFSRASGVQSSTLTRIFAESSIIKDGTWRKMSYLAENGTNCFINSEKLDLTLTPTTNYTPLTIAQTQSAANFTNFDFVNVWQINPGESPKLRDVIYDASLYFENPIDTITLTNVDLTTVKAVVNLKCCMPPAYNCYFDSDLSTIQNSENLGTLTPKTVTQYESTKVVGEGVIYSRAFINEGSSFFTMDANIYHFTLPILPITTIDITAGNYVILSNPIVKYVHGTVLVGSYLFGSTREYGGANFFKLNCSNYSDITYLTIIAAGLYQLLRLEQIVYCQGFLWMHSTNNLIEYDLLVRVNPTSLEYIVFAISDANAESALSEPIGTDGTYLYVSCFDYIRKIQPPLGDLSDYGYTQGDAAVNLPANLRLGNCPTEHIATAKPRVHSIIIDADYIYAAYTSTAATNGVSTAEQPYIQATHLQKINKHTMTTVGNIPIPKTTDDMTQNEKYIFLAPELINWTNYTSLGDDWGLIAIKKSDLSIKYLKALSQGDFGTGSQGNRSCFGIQYFGDYMLVQKNNRNEAYIIDTSQVEQWNDSFPVGGATVAWLRFTLEGAAFLTVPANELSLGSDGKFHANTWINGATTVFKFMPDGFNTFNYAPVVQSVLINSAVEQTIIGGFILSPGSSPVTEEGLQYGTDKNNLDQSIVIYGTPIDFQTILNLTPGIYFFRAYATNSVGTTYGNIIPFVVGNNIILSNDSGSVVIDVKDSNNGLAVRCCKPAPGIANGTIGSAVDVDGNTYQTIVINEKEWFCKDLKVKKYNNNDAIPMVSDNAEWAALTTGAYCSNPN